MRVRHSVFLGTTAGLSLLLASVALGTPTTRHWFSLPVPYRVYNHPSVTGVANFQSAALPAVERGFARWMGGAGTAFSCTSWRVTRGSNFSSPGDITALNAGDKQNLVIWLKGTNWTHDSFTLGVTRTSAYPGSGQILDADMEMNDNRTWKVGGTSNAVDVESITTHEAGHFLGLDHTPNLSAVMYATYLTGELKTTLQANDISDVCTVYPATSATGQQGSPCVNDTQCTAGLKCRGAVGLSGSLICTKECSTANPSCPTGYSCQDANPAGTTGKACLVPFGSPDLCDFCTDGTQCSSGMCPTDGRHNWCSIACETDQQCGPGYTCAPTNQGGKLCVPSSGKCTSQCTSASDCALGYACTNGTCEATGNEGDRCELSHYCKACTICAGNATLATCQGCCAGTGAGGYCTNCPAKTCPNGELCSTVTTKDSLCLPSGAAVCTACSPSSPCQNGLSCVGGRCHTSCNPQSPGSCAACYPTGGGGLCACSGEMAYLGQPCGPTQSGGFVACTGGSVCAGTPGVCRAPCTLGDATSCSAGDACTSVSGVAVCVPAANPGTRCSPCEAGTCGNGLECYNGRCYERCALSQPICASCVSLGADNGLCACDDQRAKAGESCGPVAGEVYACNPGLVCLQGACRQGCDPQSPNCAEAELCVAAGGGHVCALGGDAGLPFVPNVDTGPSTPSVEEGDAGCGCGNGTGQGAVLLALAVLSVTTRRRDSA